MNSLLAVSASRTFPAVILFFGCLVPCAACSIKPSLDVPTVPPVRPPYDQLGFVTYAPDARAPVHLPMNALGVIYSVGSSGAISQAKLVITEAGSAKPLAVRVTKITALQNILPAAVSPDDFLLSSSVGPEQETLYRVGPADGFRPGQRYVFTSRASERSTTHVVIDPVAVDMRSQAVRMAPASRPYRISRSSNFCLHDNRSELLMQPVAYVVPAALQPYRHLLFAFDTPVRHSVWTYSRTDVGGRSNGDWTAPYYTPQRFALDDGVFSADSAKLSASAPRPGIKTGFLELEDQLRPTAVALPVIPEAVAFYTSGEMLEHAIASGDPLKLRNELLAVPRAPDENIGSALEGTFWNRWQWPGWYKALQKTWDRQRFHWRREQLLALIATQLTHADPRVRRALPHAVLGATGYDGLGQAAARRAIRILLAALKDPDAVVRHSAIDALMVVKARVIRLDLPVPMQTFAPAIPALIGAIRHPDEMHRHNAAESLASLHVAYPQVIPAMLAAGESAETAYALWSLARNNLNVRQVLQRASRSGDPDIRRAAAMALNPPELHESPLPEPGVIREHIFEMCRHEGPCVVDR